MSRGVLQPDGTYCYTPNCQRHNRISPLQGLDTQLVSVEIPILAGKPVKTISFPHLYHVGVLDSNFKKGQSYEGSGLSVSLHPDDWRKIARLAGNTHVLTRSSNRFLHYHQLSHSQREEIMSWGIQKGYVTPVEAYEIRRWDDEWEQDLILTVDSYEEALEEAGDDPSIITKIQSYAATQTFPDNTVKEKSTHVEDILATVWVREATNLDGVWWEDDYDPSKLSAPRGVIVDSSLQGWRIVPS